MTETLHQPTVELAHNGQVIIRAEELGLPGLISTPFADRKVSGRMYLSKERSELVFEPYLVGKRMQKVRQKEVVGQVEVARYADKLKLSLSLPVKMSKELMSLTLLEQASLVAKALQSGLYERMLHTTESGETPPSLTTGGETQPQQAA